MFAHKSNARSRLRTLVCQSVNSSNHTPIDVWFTSLAFWYTFCLFLLLFYLLGTSHATCFFFFFHFQLSVFMWREHSRSVFVSPDSCCFRTQFGDVCFIYRFNSADFLCVSLGSFNTRRCSLDLNYIIRRAKNTVYVQESEKK